MSKSCSIKDCDKPYSAKGLCASHYARFKKFGDYNYTPSPQAPPEIRFWRFVQKVGHGGCWIFTGSSKTHKYGMFSLTSKTPVLAHRYSYTLHKGKIPRGKVVMHSCDNPRCVNPKHLSVGTYKENTADMYAKGRNIIQAPIGTDNGKAILTPEKVRFIRRSPDNNKVVAGQLGVSINCIRGVRIGRTWSHVK